MELNYVIILLTKEFMVRIFFKRLIILMLIRRRTVEMHSI